MIMSRKSHSRKFLRNLKIKIKYRKPITSVKRHPLIMTFILVLVILFLITNLLCTSHKVWRHKELEIVITGEFIDLTCSDIREDYEEGYIKIKFDFEKQREDDNRIYISFSGIYGTELPKAIEYSYMQGNEYLKREMFSIKKISRGLYYFDLNEFDYPNEPNVEDLSVNIYLNVGNELFPSGKRFFLGEEEIAFIRNFIFRNSELENNTSVEILFPSEWEVISCLEHESFTDLDVNNHKITLKTQKDHNLNNRIIVGTSTETKALNYTKLGILLSVYFSGVTLIITVYFYTRR